MLSEMLPRPDERLLALGMTGSGKSTLIRALLAQLPPNELVIIFDSKPDWKGRYWWDIRRSRRHLPVYLPHTNIRLLRPGVYLFRPEYPEWRDPRVEQVLIRSLRRGKMTLIIDELSDYAQNSYPIPALAKVIKQGRSKRVRVLMGSQRALAIPRIAITESNKFAVFRLRGEKDRERVAKEIDERMIEPPAGKYSFWWRDDATGDEAILIAGGVPREYVHVLDRATSARAIA